MQHRKTINGCGNLSNCCCCVSHYCKKLTEKYDILIQHLVRAHVPIWNKKRTERDDIFIKQSIDLNKVLKNVGFERGFKKEIDEGDVQQSLTQKVKSEPNGERPVK